MTTSTVTATATPAATLATLELQYFRAVSLCRRRSYERCVEVCNALLQAGHENNVQMFEPRQKQQEEEEQQERERERESRQTAAEHGSNLQRIGPRQRQRQHRRGTDGASGAGAAASAAASIMPTWLMEGVWQLKMRALTQRVYLDDLEVDEAADGGEWARGQTDESSESAVFIDISVGQQYRRYIV